MGVPDRYMGEDVIAFAVLRAGMEGDERELLAFCERRLGHFKTPTRIHFVPDLPKGPSGKVQRLRLLDNPPPASAGALYDTGHTDPAAAPIAASAIAQAIADSWADLLGQPRFDPDTNFFALGGDSLKALRCLSKIRERLPVVLSLSDFFENPTVAQLAALVEQRLHGPRGAIGVRSAEASPAAGDEVANGASPGPNPIPPRPRSSTYPLTPRQEQLWFIRDMAPESPHYNESEAVRLRGDLDPQALQRALNALVARHEMLRTTFQRAEDGVMAVVSDNGSLPMRRIALSGLAAPQRDAIVERLLIEEPRRVYKLESEPAIRATLLSLGDREHVFILMLHHIVCDRWSITVLWRELAALYQAFVRGEAPDLPALPIQHGDYAVWLRRRLAEEGCGEGLAWWEDALRDAPDFLDLPTDRPRPAIQSHRGDRKRVRLDPTLTQQLRDLSRQEKTSAFVIFAAAFNALLFRYTGSEDLVVGTPVADREREELQSLVGFLVDTHALRTRLSGDMTFRELLARVQTGLVALYKHRDVPLDQIVSRIRKARDLSRAPLFQVAINGQCRMLRPFDGVQGLVGEALLSHSNATKFDLTLYVGDDGDEIWLELEYSTDLFDGERIDRMFGHYRTLLELMAAEPDRRLSEAPILTAAEREQILDAWNDTAAAFPRSQSVHHLFEAQAERTPDAAAVVHGDRRLSYRDLNAEGERLAGRLRELGVTPGQRVAIGLERSIELVIAELAILKCGAAYVPLDQNAPAQRQAFMIEDCQARIVVTARGRPAPEIAGVRRVDVEEPLSAGQVPPAPAGPADSEAAAYVMYTSGSTGQPKGVVIPHRAIGRLALNNGYASFDFGRPDRLRFQPRI